MGAFGPNPPGVQPPGEGPTDLTGLLALWNIMNQQITRIANFLQNAITAGSPAPSGPYANRPATPSNGQTFIFTNSTVTTGNITAGGGAHENLGIWNASTGNWVVLFNFS